MTRCAILIAAEKYMNFPPTPFTHADAGLLHVTLTEHCDYPAQHALLIRLTPEDDKTPAELLDVIRRTVNRMERGDSVLFYFAGHGHYSEDCTYLLLPNTTPRAYETTALSIEDVSKELRQPERSCFRIFDACHSGVDVRGDSELPDSSNFMRAITHDASGWVTLAACRENEYSVADPQIGHGVFTYYLCEYIRGLPANEKVLPELVKIKIADSVFEHAKRLGNSQTPTLNASISGNIELAIRRAYIKTIESGTDQISIKVGLQSRIAQLQKIPHMFDAECLTQLLEFLTKSIKEEWKGRNQFSSGELSGGAPILATDIPESMYADVVTFVRCQGFQAQHQLVRWEEEYEPMTFGIAESFVSLFSKPKKTRIKYHISQDSRLPKSACILEATGDGRCIPTLKILIYVIPLQLTTCLLVSSFRQEWLPREYSLELLCNSHQIQKPEMSVENSRKFASFAVGQILEKLQSGIEARVAQLEKEIHE